MTGEFLTTHWTLVSSSRGTSPEALDALRELCARYYHPVVAFLRREGRTEDEARELAHSFFSVVLEGDAFSAADGERGRFRSYVLGAVKHFLANHRRAASREKRGGGAVHTSFDENDDRAPGICIAHESTQPCEADFDRAWAFSIIDRSLLALENETSDPRQFAVLKPWLSPADAETSQAHAAVELGISEGAVKVAVHRLRRRFRELVRNEVRQTLHDPSDLEDEMRHLIAALAK